MKRCLACNTTFSSSTSICSTCGLEPDTQAGFPAYAPDMAQKGKGFKSEYFSELARLEGKNFWFRARNRLIIWAIGKYCPDFRSFLEVGCGTGFVLSGIANAYPDVELHGSEIFTAGLVYAASRQPTINFMQMDARYIPFVDEFDAIGAFDVLEHIAEDEVVLKQMYNAVHFGGVIVLTVPQHHFLWSKIDEYACHVRRYSRDELVDKVRRSGFRIVAVTSFVSLLLPLMMFSRFLKKDKIPNDASEEFRLGRLTNWILELIMGIERLLIQLGGRFPAGGSLLLVGEKIGDKAS